MSRQNISSGGLWESRYGYSRAVRIGSRIVIAGTIAAGPDGRIECPDDAGAQTGLIIDRIREALDQAGAGLEAIILLRIYITSMEDAESVGLIIKQRLKDIRPAATMVTVANLFAGARVEIEAEALMDS